MSDENKYNISDIINFASQQNPLEIKSAIDSLMIAKVQAEIADKKIEVAKSMFGAGQDEVEASAEEPSEDDFEDDELDDEDDVEDDEDLDLDISDEELEDLLNDLENLDDTDLDDNLEDDNLDSEENDNGENA
jgi:hypothetical protein